MELRQQIDQIMDAIKQLTKKPQGYDTTAKVIHTTGQTAWIKLEGNVDTTPAKKNIDCKAGDTVQVRIANGKAYLIGNQTAPPTDDTKAKQAESQAIAAREVADDAQEKIKESVQHFWTDDTGAHISEVSKETFDADPENGGGNLLARSDGVYVRNGETTKAKFTAESVVIGEEGDEKLRTEITDEGLAVIYTDNQGIDQDWARIGQHYTFGGRSAQSYVGSWSFVEGLDNKGIGICSHAEGQHVNAAGWCSHAQNEGTTAVGDAQTAIGKYNKADSSNKYALILGNGTDNANRNTSFAITWDGTPISESLTGSVILFAGIIFPQGYLVCDGSAVSRTLYANLFDVIGTTYGAGDGSTTFNLPDLTAQAPANMRYIIHTGF